MINHIINAVFAGFMCVCLVGLLIAGPILFFGAARDVSDEIEHLRKRR